MAMLAQPHRLVGEKWQRNEGHAEWHKAHQVEIKLQQQKKEKTKSHKGSSFDQSFHIYEFSEATRRTAEAIWSWSIHPNPLLFIILLCLLL